MSYTTTPNANRLGYNRGWMFQLIPQNTNIPNATSTVYLKSYFILKEYLRFYQINLLSFYIQPFTPTINLIHLMVYKHIRYTRKKPHPVFIDRLNKQGFFKVLNVFKKEHNMATIKAISAVGSKNTWQNTVSFLQKSNSYKTLHLVSQKIKRDSKRAPLYRLNQNVKFRPKTLINFMAADVRKLVEFKQRRDLKFIVQLRRLDISLHQFCTTLHDIHLQELILCVKNVLNNQGKKQFEANLGLSTTFFPKPTVRVKHRNKIDKGLTQKNLKFSAKARKKNFLWRSKLKILLQSDIATRLRLAKKIMSYWKLINCYRDQFYVNYHGVTLKSFLNKNLCKNDKITAIMFGKGKKILQNHDFAKQTIFSIVGLDTDKFKLNKSNMYFYLYNHIFQRQNSLNKSSALLSELNTLKSIHKHTLVSKQPLQLRYKVIPSQNFILKKGIKMKKEIYKPVLNNQLQLNYLFESYLQNICKIPSMVKVISTSPNVWLKKTYDNVKSKPRLKRAAEGRFFKRLLFAFINAERYMTPQLIADLIAHELAIPRKHKPLLRNINALFDAVHSRYILGYKIVVDGKLNGVMKSTKQIIKFKGKDKMPVQEFHKRVLYALGVSRTYTGLFGVRVWLYY